MLRWRLLLGTLLVIGLAGLCWLDAHRACGFPPGGWLAGLAILISVTATGEMLWMLRSRPVEERPIRWVAHAGNGLIILAAISPSLVHVPKSAELVFIAFMAATLGSVLLAFVVEILSYRPAARPVTRLGLTLLIWAYVPVLMSCIVALRLMDTGRPFYDDGMLELVSMIVVVKMGDTGRLYGRSNVWPA